MALSIDLNCDLGEGGGVDAELMPWVTSANIACGGHAGDEATMRATVRRARRFGVAVGAHPGYPDREHFGRRERPVSPAALVALVREQTAALRAVAADDGAEVTHLKLHGALYNQASRDPELAEALVEALRSDLRGLVLYALSGSVLERRAREAIPGRVRAEVFADRAYEPDGSLRLRSLPGALLEEPGAAERQVLALVRDGRVQAWNGAVLSLRAETVCLHGDGPDPVGFARRLRAALASAGIAVRSEPPGRPSVR